MPPFSALVRLATGLWLALASLVLAAEPVVLASIKPLELIARQVVGPDGQVERLLAPGASPHDYPLSFSDRKRLDSADLVFWVGEELETFLHRPLAQLPSERRLAATELSGLHWPQPSEEEHAGQAHHYHAQDPHLWLDPRNGGRIARALAERLAQLAPEAAEDYRSRARTLAEQLHRLDLELDGQLDPVRDRSFAVYHRGYDHFVQRYGLHQVAAVTETPERRPGARHLYQLRQRLEGATCLFIEPYYDMSAARQLAEELDLHLAQLDPLGADPGIDSYPALIRQLGNAVLDCLRAGERKAGPSPVPRA